MCAPRLTTAVVAMAAAAMAMVMKILAQTSTKTVHFGQRWGNARKIKGTCLTNASFLVIIAIALGNHRQHHATTFTPIVLFSGKLMLADPGPNHGR